MSTVAEGMPNVLRFIVGCMPLYLGYSVLGTVMFGRISDDFASVRRTWVTLFSLLNGDSMLDVFDGVYTPGLGGLVSQVYLVTFICFFICEPAPPFPRFNLKCLLISSAVQMRIASDALSL